MPSGDYECGCIIRVGASEEDESMLARYCFTRDSSIFFWKATASCFRAENKEGKNAVMRDRKRRSQCVDDKMTQGVIRFKLTGVDHPHQQTLVEGLSPTPAAGLRPLLLARLVGNSSDANYTERVLGRRPAVQSPRQHESPVYIRTRDDGIISS